MSTISVSDDFDKLCKNLRMSETMVSRIQTRYHAITKRINEEYWHSTSDTLHSMYSGSYGRGTAIFVSDVDIIVELPLSVFDQYDAYAEKGQTALLQDVRKSLQKTYANSSISADGQVVDIRFADGITFEVVPAFKLYNGKYIYADTNNGGSWRTMDPKAEIAAINALNNENNGNVKRLCRMIRAWNYLNSVLMSGYLIDATVCRFMANYEYSDKLFTYYDWFSRDYFKYLASNANQSYWVVPGSNTHVPVKHNFVSAANAAYKTVEEALSASSMDNKYLWSAKWRSIYGSSFPG